MPAALWVVASLAWGAIGLGAGGVLLPAFCAPAAALWLKPAASLDLVLALNPPAMLAIAWALMLAAMMPPLIIEPLRHIRNRSFARRRGRAMALFILGYGAAWMAAGAALQALALALRIAARESPLLLLTAVAAAVIWQVSPAKQYCLNACHRRPPLAAFGAAAALDAVSFGLRQGAWCVGTCWALMVLPLLVRRGHLLTMMLVALFLLGERFERPAPCTWRLRGPGKALRIVAAQARMRLDRIGCSRMVQGP